MEINDTKIGVITSGIPYQYVKEALPNATFVGFTGTPIAETDATVESENIHIH